MGVRPNFEGGCTRYEVTCAIMIVVQREIYKDVSSFRIFGLGFLRSCANRQSYVHFLTGMHHYYGTMEDCLDHFDSTSIVGRVWRQFPELRRTNKLRQDLIDIGAIQSDEDAFKLPRSPATADYCNCIASAATIEHGTPLLGHLYVRYFAGCLKF